MGIRNYSILGPSGSGKTTVGGELASRGFFVVNTDDRPISRWVNTHTGKEVSHPPEPIDKKWRVAHAWIWDINYLTKVANDPRHRETFFCGGSNNYDEAKHLFDKIFMLYTNSEVLKNRLQKREPNRWTDDSYELAQMLEFNERVVAEKGEAILIDGSRPVKSVADEILSYTDEN